jgi:excisionase family DNA binding protein
MTTATHTDLSVQRTAPPRQAFTIKEFSAAYRIGRTKIWEEIRDGKLKAKRSGKRVLILASDAHAWAQSLLPAA